jgi:hypothetical protein
MIALNLALLALQATTEGEVPPELTTGALLFMLVSMTAVTALTVWCFTRILRGKAHFDPDGTGPARPPVPGELEQRERRPD